MVVILNEECAFRYTFESKLKRTKVVQKGPCGFKDYNVILLHQRPGDV